MLSGLVAHWVLDILDRRDISFKQRRQANLVLDASFALQVLLGKPALAKDLVHFFEGSSLGFGDEEEDPDDADGGDGSEEDLPISKKHDKAGNIQMHRIDWFG